MKLFRYRSPDEKLESWLRDEYQRMVLGGAEMGRHTADCPDEEFLLGLARKPSQTKLDDKRLQHASTCPRCMRKFLDFRELATRERRRWIYVATGAIAVLLVAISLAAFSGLWNRQKPPESETVAEVRTIDLTAAGTIRGSDNPLPLKSVALPKGVIQLTLILPRFSETGPYTVAVSNGRNNEAVIAKGQGTAITDNDGTRVTVLLDLRQIRPGSYFLSTIHDRDGAYYYPLTIR